MENALQRLLKKKNELEAWCDRNSSGAEAERSLLRSYERDISRMQNAVDAIDEYALMRKRLAAIEPAIPEVIEVLKLSCSRYDDNAKCHSFSFGCASHCATFIAVSKAKGEDTP